MVGTGAIIALLGTRGTGKTQMAVCLAQYACFQGLSAMYAKAIDVFIRLRESYRDDKSESGVIMEFCKPSLLVIDAMENRGETDFEDRLLNHIIDRRYDNMVDTILITNQVQDVFQAMIGPSIVDRICENGGYIECTWGSFRGQS